MQFSTPRYSTPRSLPPRRKPLTAEIIASMSTRELSGCWLWNSGQEANRYCRYGNRKHSELVHRLSYTLFKGAIPEGGVVRHTCNIPNCVNPDHLALGTQRDNIHDAVIAMRHCHGETHGMHKLTEEEVLQIRRMLDDRVRHHVLADKFNVSVSLIAQISNRTLWKYL
jgi:hypothetical protein